MKASFLNSQKPLLCAMIQCHTPDECCKKIELSIKEGAEAIAIQLDQLEKSMRTSAHLKQIFNACEGKPIYVTSYRTGKSMGMTDDECVELLLLALECGATLFDVMGDLYSRSPQYELTMDDDAITKQMALIDKIHQAGGEVLMSSHTYKSITLDECLMIAREQARRGADVIKIVNDAISEDEVPVYIDAINKIIKETGKKLLFLASGKAEIIRYIGPSFGVCMYLTVVYHSNLDTEEQPTLKRAKEIRENIVFL